MEDRIDKLERRLAELEQRVETINRRSRRRLAAATMVAVLAVAWASTPEARAQFGLSLMSLNNRLMVVEARTSAFSIQGSDLMISGVNVHVVDGSGSTSSTTGLGNLTVGYNGTRGAGLDARNGSHNLIVGDQNNYTSSGGFVAGFLNEIDGQYASVSGGSYNTASGGQSSVSGGSYNTASSSNDSVSGGLFNTANGGQSSVSGGSYNTASGAQSSVSGGSNNTASGDDSSVSGGVGNTASGELASVSGGSLRSAGDYSNWAAGNLTQPN